MAGRRLASFLAALGPLVACVAAPVDDDGAAVPHRTVAVDPGESPGELASAPAHLLVLGVCSDAAYTTISDALAAAPAGAVIRICPGVYPEHLDLTRPVSLIGAGADLTILDGGEDGRVVRARGMAASIEGVTIQRGRARRPTTLPAGTSSDDDDGAGIGCVNGALRIAHSVIRDNVADRNGGGISARGCTVELDDVEVRDNKAVSGGGLFATAPTVEITGSRFLGNRASTGGGVWSMGERFHFTGNIVAGNRAPIGGGLHIDVDEGWFAENVFEGNYGGGLRIESSGFTALRDNLVTGNTGSGYWLARGAYTISGDAFRDNTAHSGGAITFFGADVWLSRVLVEGNRALASGGGIYATGIPGYSTSLTVDDSIVRDNVADSGSGTGTDGGGGLFIYGGLRVRRSVIAHNEAARGGGIVSSVVGQPVELTGSTFEGNVATGDGGAVQSTFADLLVRNCVFTANRASNGGALSLDGAGPHVRVEQSTFHANDASAGSAIAVAGTHLTATGNVLAYGSVRAHVVVRGASTTVDWRYNNTFPATFSGLPDPTGTDGNLAADPRFAGELRLGPGSACIDSGPPDVLDADGTRADMGAFGGPEPLLPP